MAQQLKSCKSAAEAAISDPNMPWTPIFDVIETKSGVKRIYVFGGLLILTVLYLAFGYAAQLLCNIIGFLYPAYASMRAIESPQKGDDTKWLTYWTVFALFSIIEFPSDMLLSWFPFYWLVKCIFMIWLFMPISSNGSIVLYENLIRPRFLKHSEGIDNMMSKLAGTAAKAVIDVTKAAKEE